MLAQTCKSDAVKYDLRQCSGADAPQADLYPSSRMRALRSNLMKSFYFSAPLARRIPDPLFKNVHGLERHLFVVPVRTMPRDLPLDPNARRPNTNRRVYKLVEQSLLNKSGEPGTFHLKNKGITIIASRVEARGSDKYEIFLEPGHGI